MLRVKEVKVISSNETYTTVSVPITDHNKAIPLLTLVSENDD